MKLNDRYDGSNVPFQGDRTLLLRSIPVNARIERATVTLTPVDATNGANPFAESIKFNGPSGGWGATKIFVPGNWVEVDFHARRTLARVNGTNLNTSTLQVDMGGAYVEINENGGIMTPDGAAAFEIQSDSHPLPALTVTKLKLTKAAPSPDISEVVIRSVPTNASLRLGAQPPFFSRVGEMVQPETSADFSAVLQAFLADAKTKTVNGFYEVPIIIHSDTIARITVQLEVDYLVEQNVLAGSLGQVALEYDLSTLPKAEAAALRIKVPANSRVAKRGTSARVTGTFADTRIVHAPNEGVSPSGAVDISGTLSHAQPIRLGEDKAATAVDLLVRVDQFIKLQLDIRDDLDGKPDNVSLLPAPVAIELSGRVGVEKGKATAVVAHWVSLELPAEFQFKAGKTCWLVLQSVEGQASWSVESAPAGALPMQRTQDGGLSWRAAGLKANPQNPLAGFFRLRRRPESFQMPIRLEVGDGKDAVPVSLERFQPLGRIDFTLDFDEVAEAFNEYIATASKSACPAGEHIINGNFERWLRIGDQLKPPTSIPLSTSPPEPPTAIAVSPDGARAFVAQVLDDDGFLHIIDVACDKTAGIIPVPLEPRRMIINPQGHRIYASDRQRLLLVDTATNQAIGAPFDLRPAVQAELQAQVRAVRPSVTSVALNNYSINALAMSPDGSLLYVLESLTAFISTLPAPFVVTRIRSLNTANLERIAAGEQVTFAETTAAVAQIDQGLPAGSVSEGGLLTASSNGSRLYATIATGTLDPNNVFTFGGNELRVLDATTFQMIGTPVALNGFLTSIALAAKDRLVLVTDLTGSAVTVIDTARPGTPASIAIALPPVAIKVSSEGTRAYVVATDNNGSDSTLNIIDLTRAQGQVSKTIPVGRSARAVALTPQGDRVYVAGMNSQGADSLLTSIQIGARLPEEWNLTSGTVAPVCVGEPFHLIAALGSLSKAGNPAQTALSQVMPVAQSCAYEFSFMGRATDEDGVAEIFWISSECGMVGKPEVVPIEAGEIPDPPPPIVLPPAGPVDPPIPQPHSVPAVKRAALPTDSGVTPDQIPPLVLHRKRLTVPAGANQAEVRFRIPPVVIAGIDQVSLIATTEAAENGDFKSQKDGELQGWEVVPVSAPGFSLVAVDGGIELRNLGTVPVELLQTTAASAGQEFTLEVEGETTLRAPSGSNPRVELRWLKADGASAGATTTMEISPTSFGVSQASGVALDEATQVEIHLIVPGGVVQTVKRISLSFSPATIVPIRFIADAPGELVISDLRIAFEKAELPPPPVPQEGLCSPTPPGRQPGESDDGCCFCPSCDAEQAVKSAMPVRTRAGRPAVVGQCSKCGTESVRFGGARVAGAQAMSLHSAAIHQPLLFTPPLHKINGEAAIVINNAPEPAPQLTDIGGIGEVRSRKLSEAGIDSVAKLAKATPQTVANVTKVIEKVADEFIAEARKLIGLK